MEMNNQNTHKGLIYRLLYLMVGPACIGKVQYKWEILWLGLVLKDQGWAGNHVAGSDSEGSRLGWYILCLDLFLKGLVLAGNSAAGPVSERSSIVW